MAMSGASGFDKFPTSRSSGHDDRPDPNRGLYGISVAAELVGSAPQNLRLYETRGLINPARSHGGTRRYSDDDLVRLRQIGLLLDDGLNLAGIAAVLGLRGRQPRTANPTRPDTPTGVRTTPSPDGWGPTHFTIQVGIADHFDATENRRLKLVIDSTAKL